MSDTENVDDVHSISPFRTCRDSSKSVDSIKLSKLKRIVSFSNIDKFHYTEWQEPEPIDEGGANIESMISGDDDSSSHVSFKTLDKSSAGKTYNN